MLLFSPLSCVWLLGYLVDCSPLATVADFIFLGFRITVVFLRYFCFSCLFAKLEKLMFFPWHLISIDESLRDPVTVGQHVRDYIAVPQCLWGTGYRTPADTRLWGCSVKWKSLSHVRLFAAHGLYYTVHGILQTEILEWEPFLFPGDLPNPGIEPRSPALHVDSLPAEPPGKPKNTGVGSLSLLQQISPT